MSEEYRVDSNMETIYLSNKRPNGDMNTTIVDGSEVEVLSPTGSENPLFLDRQASPATGGRLNGLSTSNCSPINNWRRRKFTGEFSMSPLQVVSKRGSPSRNQVLHSINDTGTLLNIIGTDSAELCN